MDYASAGVNIQSGDQASKAAYANAKKTFASRQGLMGQPFEQEGGFAGALDMGDFLLIQNDDGTGTKHEIADRLGKYDTLGDDLAAMVVDDAICVGAEVISLTNTLDTPNVDPESIQALTAGLAEACKNQKIVIPGGEIAELSDALNRPVWNATAVGIVKKDKFITGADIQEGDAIIGLAGRVIRSNGATLARKICEKAFGDNWHQEKFDEDQSWGEVLLTPSKIYHRVLLDHVLGDFEGTRKFPVKGLAHITGGGVPGNLPRIFPDASLGAELDNLHEPHEALKQLVQLGDVSEDEAYKTWHCGTAMMLIIEPNHAESLCQTLNAADPELQAQVVGHVTDTGKINIISKF